VVVCVGEFVAEFGHLGDVFVCDAVDDVGEEYFVEGCPHGFYVFEFFAGEGCYACDACG
jgi:hypothetical protein